MNDRIVGIFEDRPTAEGAARYLADSGVDSSRMTVKRVLPTGHRGLGNSDKVHSLLYAPEIYEEETMMDDTGTVILIVDVPVGADSASVTNATGELDAGNVQGLMSALERLGSTDIQLIPPTPGLDL